MSQSAIVCLGLSHLKRHLGTRNAGIKARKRELHTSLAGSTMMLISNLVEAHRSSIACCCRQATLQDISKANLDCHASWFTIFKMHNTVTGIVVFHYCTLITAPQDAHTRLVL